MIWIKLYQGAGIDGPQYGIGYRLSADAFGIVAWYGTEAARDAVLASYEVAR